MSKKVSGQLYVEIYVDCPFCANTIDLFDVDSLNEEGFLWHVIERWRGNKNDLGWENIGAEFECPKCKKELVWDELNY